ncbi:MAG: CoA transferase [Myxococcota bacterium]|nr:CoA transferase [Myxococcota bacterium]
MAPTSDFKPLEGIRVLDLSRYLPGPYLTRMLADLGADIIKVESPSGDPARYTPPQSGSYSALFGAVNAGKRSIVLDFKKEAGVAILKELVPHCDVVVESFRPGVATRLGIDYEQLSAINPRIIMCSISGFGQRGPLASVPGHDLNYIARAGVLGLFGPADAPPPVPGVQMADVAGGALTASTGVLAALIERDKTGKGRFLDISMTRSVLSLAATSTATLGLGMDAPRGKDFLSGGVPCYQVYPTRDGRFMSLGALEPTFFATFCELAGVPELASSIYATGEEGDTVIAKLRELFLSKTQREWVELLQGAEVCCEPVKTMSEALEDPDLGLAQGDIDGYRVVLPHLGVDLSTEGLSRAPHLGEHGEEILKELNISTALRDEARRDDAVWLSAPEAS